MEKRGFTLIELLAVIIILSIVALIAVPSVINNIETSKRSSFKVSIQNMVRQMQTTQASQNYIALTYTFPLPVNTTLKLDGDTSKWMGTSTIDVDGKITLAIYDGKYCAYKKKTDFDFEVVTGKTKTQCLAMIES